MVEPGQLVDGKYRVVRLLGKGGMGAVFEGYHTLVDRRVAIKVLLPDAISSEHGAARFEREVRATGRIGNDHILEVYDVGVLPDGSRYMVSEFLDGETLADRLERGPLQPKLAAELTLQLLDGLGAAHDKGVVHRDLKPENLFLLRQKAGRTDFLKIIDFGISKFQLEDTSSMSMTATGTVLGTPYYLSPEQARGQRDIDHRSDLYAVGVILYQAVTGRVPFSAESFNELLFKIALETARPLTTLVPNIDPAFSAIVAHAMARAREERFQSAREMAEALSRWLELPVSGELVTPPARGSMGNITLGSVETLTASRGLPTTSNFGLTTAPELRRASRLRVFMIAAGVLGLAGAAAVAFTLAERADDEQQPVPAVTSSLLPSAATAERRVPSVVPPEPPLFSLPERGDEPALRVPRDEPRALHDDEPPAPRLVRPDRPRTEPRASRPAAARPAATATTPPAPRPSSTAKPRRDFGY